MVESRIQYCLNRQSGAHQLLTNIPARLYNGAGEFLFEMTNAFEESAQEYDDWFVRNEFAYHSELAAIKACLPTNGHGLEIGAGTGRFAAPLGIKVGVEPARAMAEIARIRGTSVIRGYAEALPFADDSFDFVLMVTVLCFLSNPFQALDEATRVLKPPGRLIIGMIDPASPLGQSYELNKEKSKFYRQARFLPVEEVLKWLKRLGYLSLQIHQTIFRDPAMITALEPVRTGQGEGVFVVISAQKVS
jgi:ubiquinone/menaquinone biosynthesis C-methylase UbiE